MFHPPESADPWWTETVWFSWNVPERNLLGYWYAVFRANLGVTFGGVLVVDDTAVLPWEIPVFDWHWHEPMPEAVDLGNLDVMGGMTLQCLEYGRVFRFGYENDDVEFDLEFRALMQPMLTRHEPPFNHGTHVDQPGRVRGRHATARRRRRGRLHRDARPVVGDPRATSPAQARVLPRDGRRGQQLPVDHGRAARRGRPRPRLPHARRRVGEPRVGPTHGRAGRAGSAGDGARRRRRRARTRASRHTARP